MPQESTITAVRPAGRSGNALDRENDRDTKQIREAALNLLMLSRNDYNRAEDTARDRAYDNEVDGNDWASLFWDAVGDVLKRRGIKAPKPNSIYCHDCGIWGVTTGHMECQYPQDR